MNIRRLFFLTALSVAVTASTASPVTIVERLYTDPKFQIFSVIFGVTVDSHSKVQSLRIEKVSDSRRDSSKPIRVQIPQSFLAAVRRRAESKHYPPKFKRGEPVEFFIYYWYSPAYPSLLISDWEKSPEEQP